MPAMPGPTARFFRCLPGDCGFRSAAPWRELGEGPKRQRISCKRHCWLYISSVTPWDHSQPVEPWVRGIARYKMIDALRRRGFTEHRSIDDFADVFAAPQTDEAGTLAARDLLTKLPERDRQIVQAMSIEGRSAKEAGAPLGMTEGAVRVALHRALKVLASAARKGDL